MPVNIFFYSTLGFEVKTNPNKNTHIWFHKSKWQILMKICNYFLIIIYWVTEESVRVKEFCDYHVQLQ